MILRRNGTALLLVMGLSLLAACESSKDKAARHLQSALALIEKGDADRAIVEFRNVFKLDPDNRDARMAFGGLMQERGNLPEAYVQYQQVAEKSPTDQEALKAASKAAAEMGRWPEAGRFADQALALSPDDMELQAIKIGVDYATAFSAADAAGRGTAAQAAQAMLAKLPASLLLHRVVIDNLMQTASYPAALVAIDAAQAQFPDEKGLYLLRVSALAAARDDAGVEVELQKMVGMFPQDISIGATLFRWYVSRNETDKAEAFLRDKAKDGDLAARLDLVNFLRQYRSVDVALAELDEILVSMPATTEPAAEGATSAAPQNPITPETVRALRASILFDQGKQDEAIKAMQDILAAAPPSDQVLKIKVMLARMMFTTGNSVQARATVEEVLLSDAGEGEALKLKAAWLIEDDKTDDAVALLRKALDATPSDAEALTLMAQAYDRAGNHELTGDMLSQAVIASGKAPAESLRYASFLIGDEKYLPAETLLIDALRLDPANVTILANLGRLYGLMKDWPRAIGVVDRLDELATPEAIEASQGLRPGILAGQQKVDAAIEYLQGLAGNSDAGLDAQTALIRAYLSNGQADKARALADDMLTKTPEDASVRFIAAAVQAAMGEVDAAAKVYRDLVTEDPSRGTVWLALVSQVLQEGKRPEAEAVLDEAIGHLPDAAPLLLMKAGLLEQRQDAEGAIAIYQKLYEADSSNQILANNLASMLSNYRTDPESLEQAYTIARRLRGTKTPAFADTYGWIAQQRGNAQEALSYMELAAQGLPEDPLVQFHLAEVYKALSRTEDARAQYAKVVAMVPAEDPRDFVKIARTAVAQP